MSRKQRHSSRAFWDIAMLTPAIVATRTRTMMLESLQPSAKGRREMQRMVSEKPAAVAEAFAAAQQVMFKQGLALWTDTVRASDWAATVRASNRFWINVAAELAPAALAPISRRVRTNSRRLSGS